LQAVVGTAPRVSYMPIASFPTACIHRGALEVMNASLGQFRAAIVRENHTLKRILTDQHILSGIGNAYSDEILHRARLSPLRQSQKLSEGEVARLYTSTQETLSEWIQRLRASAEGSFPEKVTAFRPEMAVHGKF